MCRDTAKSGTFTEPWTPEHAAQHIAHTTQNRWDADRGWMQYTEPRWTPTTEVAVTEAVRVAVIDCHTTAVRAGADTDQLAKLTPVLSARGIRRIVARIRGNTTGDAHADGGRP